MMAHMTQWILTMLQTHGATAVFVGVVIESIIVPIPSPLIIMGAGAILVPAGLSWAQAFSPMVWNIILPGATASTLGAYFAFGIAFWGGKPIIDRFRHFLGFSWDHLKNMENHMAGRVPLMLFLLRAIPIIPLSLISAVAGVVRVPVWQFTFWTFLGSIPRCLILGYLGFLMKDTYQGFANRLNHIESLASVVIVAGTIALILWLRSYMHRKMESSPSNKPTE